MILYNTYYVFNSLIRLIENSNCEYKSDCYILFKYQMVDASSKYSISLLQLVSQKWNEAKQPECEKKCI